VLIEAIVDLLVRSESDHSFANLERALRPSPHISRMRPYSSTHCPVATMSSRPLQDRFFASRMVRGEFPMPEAVRPRRAGRRSEVSLSVSVCTRTQNIGVVLEGAG
jgi:hypothetical protein